MARLAHLPTANVDDEYMRITHVSASNWRNFKTLDFPLENRLFVVGPNAAGKSNLLDIFRFVGDIARPIRAGD
jgi:predicted ATPase